MRVMSVARPGTIAGLMAAVVLLVGSNVVGTAAAATLDTAARQAILIDVSTDTVLFEKNSTQRMPTSSMSKIMTMYMVFDALHHGKLSLTDTLPVSERAWRMQKTSGSNTFVELGNRIKVEDLVRGVIVQSGNDAAIVFAEGLAGSEDAFSREMTKRAKELGLSDSNFTNSTGWPDDNHYSTARDLALLSRTLIRDFPEYYAYFSELEFTYHKIRQANRNVLLDPKRGCKGCDGIKTGHAESAGYGLAASAIRDGRRLVLVINGLPTSLARGEEGVRLIEWGFREFSPFELFKPGQVVDEAPVWLGAQATVPLVVAEGLKVTLKQDERKGMKVTLSMDVPVPAPVVKGTRLGKITISAPGFIVREVPVIAGASVERLGLVGKMVAAAKWYVLGRT
ncbi:serine-type D-Ala-D-Ala carboxypeptidase (penicillin-binding protein 5/6) [uncultured Gammaproteobacteria bacterium]